MDNLYFVKDASKAKKLEIYFEKKGVKRKQKANEIMNTDVCGSITPANILWNRKQLVVYSFGIKFHVTM